MRYVLYANIGTREASYSCFSYNLFEQHDGDFPLYTEAIKFFNSRESMVRVAVRTLTLNVLRGTSGEITYIVCC